MNKNDYKRTLDSVKCSDEFKAKMEKMLSAPEGSIPEGYEDSVSTVEIAPKRSWLRYGAAAAAAVVVIGGTGTGAYRYFSGMDDDKPDNKTSYQTPWGSIDSMSIEIVQSNGEGRLVIEAAPETLVTDIAGFMNNETWDEQLEAPKQPYSDIWKNITIHCKGETPYTFTVSSYDEVVCTFDTPDSEQRFDKSGTPEKEGAYSTINGIIAKNLLSCDLSGMDMSARTADSSDEGGIVLPTRTRAQISEIFNRNADLCTYNGDSFGALLINEDSITASNVDNAGYSYINDDLAGLYIGDQFLIHLNSSDQLEIFYLTGSGTGASLDFTVPETLGREICDAINDRKPEPAPWGDEEWNSSSTLSFYNNGEYHTYLLTPDGPLKQYLDKLDWCGSTVPVGEFDEQNEFDFYINTGILRLNSEGGATYQSVSGDDSKTDMHFYRFDSSVYDDLKNILHNMTGEDFTVKSNIAEKMRERWTADEEELFCSYCTDPEHAGLSFSFRTDNAHKLQILDIVENAELQVNSNHATNAELYADSFVIGDFIFDKFGNIYDVRSGMYATIIGGGESVNAIYSAIVDAIKADDIAYVQYLLVCPEKDYTTLEAEMTGYFNVTTWNNQTGEMTENYLTGGKGRIWYDKEAGSDYIAIDDADNNCKIDYVRTRDGMCYLESGAHEQTLERTSVSIDIELLRESLCAGGGMMNIHDKSCEITDLGNGLRHISIHLSFEENGGRSSGEDIEFTVDDHGTPVSCSMIYFDNTTGEQSVLVKATVGDGNGGGITYDGADFAFPTLTEQQHNLINR